MQKQKNGSLEWYQFELLSDLPRVKHHLFLRNGGASLGSYSSLNVDYYGGDVEKNVAANFQIIEKQLALDIPSWKKLIYGLATHESLVSNVNDSSLSEIPSSDGLMTSTPHLTLMMKHADCQIAFFYDPKNHVVANVHAGWRGSVLNIYAKTVQKLKERYGSKPSDLLVCISPSLGPDESEFINFRFELPEEFWQFQVRPTFFDFWSISEHQLQTAGILPHHIEIARLSTYANAHDFFSYRRDKITGRHAACITLL